MNKVHKHQLTLNDKVMLILPKLNSRPFNLPNKKIKHGMI